MKLVAWLIFFLQVVGLTSAKTQQVLDIIEAHHDATKTAEPGSQLVDAAIAELRKIPVSHHRRARKPHGILATVLHYTWMAVPGITLSAPLKEDSTVAMPVPLRSAVSLLQEAAVQNNSDATYLLAEMNFYGNYSHPRNFDVAFGHYSRLALNTGNTTAMFMLGMMYSTGVGGSVPQNQAKALLYYTAAADQGHTGAQMAVGFRHYAGIGTPKNCGNATHYYKQVADKAMEWYKAGPLGGHHIIPQANRISDKNGGVYGRGASAISSGHNAITASLNTDAYSSIEDVIEYFDLLSQKGDVKASCNLGRLYYEGQRDLGRNMELAKKYFLNVARKYWKKNGQVMDGSKPGIDKYAGKAAGYLGRMYLRGEGVTQNYEKAFSWFERGVHHGDALSQWGRGVMALHGYHVKQNIGLATDFFKAATEQDFAPAYIELGILHLDQGTAEDLEIASNYFELAVRYSSLEASYYLAEMSLQGIGREKQCSVALSYYKNVAERAEPLVSSWLDANEAYQSGENELAFLEYLIAAEQGYERAQNNIAFMIDSARRHNALSLWLGKKPSPSRLLEDPTLALIYWTRSSRQANVDSLVKMGDYFLHGIGTKPDVDKAAQCYVGASEYHMSAQALYNLGWMHENGVGMTQDFHLAKRYYDFALETNQEAYLPVTLSLLKLRARSAWNTLTHGRINSIQDDPLPKKDWSLSEWIANFLMEDDYGYFDEDYYEDDLYDDGPHGGEGLEGLAQDHYLDSLVIVMLAAALVLLLYYRRVTQQEEQERRAREQQAAGVGNQVQRQQPLQGVGARGAQQGGGRGNLNAEVGFNQDDFLWPAGGIGL